MRYDSWSKYFLCKSCHPSPGQKTEASHALVNGHKTAINLSVISSENMRLRACTVKRSNAC